MSPALTTARDGTLVVRRHPLPAGTDPLAVWAASTAEHRSYFSQDGFAIAAIGAAAQIGVDGPGAGITPLTEARLALIDRLDRVDDVMSLLVGGAAFGTVDRSRGPQWRRFPASRFVLPELLVLRRGDRSWAVTVGDISAACLTEVAAAPPVDPAPLHGLPAIDTESDPGYQRVVAGAVDAIRSSVNHAELQKVVLARCLHVTDPEPYAGTTADLAGVLARLRQRYPDCATFGLAAGDETFFGATPERLVSRYQGIVRSAAVAGSIARGSDPEADRTLGRQLLSSAKDHAEHRYVANYLKHAFATLGIDVAVPETPELLRLRNIAHLYTPVIGQVGPDGPDVLQVAAALHPTPAVAGTPTPAAVQYINQHESFDRGWYAAPIGWFDLAGDGELRVGLRSALLDPDGLHVFAGAGIVADSDPAAELAETAVKLNALVDTLTAGS